MQNDNQKSYLIREKASKMYTGPATLTEMSKQAWNLAKKEFHLQSTQQYEILSFPIMTKDRSM